MLLRGVDSSGDFERYEERKDVVFFSTLYIWLNVFAANR